MNYLTAPTVNEFTEIQVEEPIIYPIDDLLVKPSADDPNFTDRPTPSTDFHVPTDCVGDLLMVWNFFTSFGTLLHLWPFSLEDFENAICHKDSELMLILESHSAILKFLIKDGGDYFTAIQNKRKKLKVSLIVLFLPDLPVNSSFASRFKLKQCSNDAFFIPCRLN